MKRFFIDIYWVFWREMKRFFMQKTRILMSVIQPMLWLVLMGSNLAGLAKGAQAGHMLGHSVNYLAFMTPGIMIMTALFGGVFGGMSVLWDRRLGFLNKMLAAPIHRAAIPLGKLAGLMVQSWIQVVVIVLVAMAMGVRIVTGVPGVIAMLLLASLFGIIMGGISLALAACITSMEALFAVTNFLTMPLMFTSNAMFPTRAMPIWMQHIAAVNPLSFAVEPMRMIATVRWNSPDWSWVMLGHDTLILLALAIASALLAISQFDRAIA